MPECRQCGCEIAPGGGYCPSRESPTTWLCGDCFDKPAVPPKEPEQDKEYIWEECPACAYKHLTAAYAALTALADSECFATAAEILAARAVIAAHEAEDGYIGNADLAAGCLALAESLQNEPRARRKAWRDARLAIKDGATAMAGMLTHVTFAALAAAHITEALRELPALADRTFTRDFLSYGNFSPESVPALREWLRDSIRWTRKTYELGASWLP